MNQSAVILPEHILEFSHKILGVKAFTLCTKWLFKRRAFTEEIYVKIKLLQGLSNEICLAESGINR
jgi:hypothetical protein